MSECLYTSPALKAYIENNGLVKTNKEYSTPIKI